MEEIKKTFVWDGARCSRFSKIVVEQYINPQGELLWRYMVYNRNGEETFSKDGLKAKPSKSYTIERFF